MLPSRKLFDTNLLRVALVPLTMGAMLLGGAAQADVVVINGRLSIGVGQSQPNYVYPDYYPGYRTYRTPTQQIFTGRIEDSTLINPVIVGAPIEDSTLINPVFVPPNYRRTVVHPGYGFSTVSPGQGNPSCASFQSMRVACR